jgi:hypothetical protein
MAVVDASAVAEEATKQQPADADGRARVSVDVGAAFGFRRALHS